MLETVIAVLLVTSTFLCLFKLSQMLMGKILLEHAAMRVARARTVGFNDFMCRKSARVAVIPVSGKRLWPDGDQFDWSRELFVLPIYMATENEAVARGVMEYENWQNLGISPGDGCNTQVRLKGEYFDLDGKGGVENNFSLYMMDQGL